MSGEDIAPALRRSARRGTLQHVLAGAPAAMEESSERVSVASVLASGIASARYLARLARTPRYVWYRNVEGDAAFDFRLSRLVRTPGVTAMLRIKNEGSKIGVCLASIIDLFDEVLIVDNGSEDDTRARIDDFAREHDRHGKIRVVSYPHRIARCGAEHAATDPLSLHSTVYFYNFARSLCQRRVVVKWDGDMVAAADRRSALAALLRRLGRGHLTRAISLGGQTVYRDLQGHFHAFEDELYAEPRIFPNSAAFRFAKGNLFERLDLPARSMRLAGRWFYELKFASEDELSHWVAADLSAAPRKRVESAHLRAFGAGAVPRGRFTALGPDFLTEQGAGCRVHAGAPLRPNERA